jgi:hypothetical protein
MDIKIGREEADWIKMAWDRTKWKAFKELVIKVKKLLAN